jgi:hypothetical protein
MSGNGSAPVKVMAVYVVEKGKPMVQAGTVTFSFAVSARRGQTSVSRTWRIEKVRDLTNRSLPTAN